MAWNREVRERALCFPILIEKARMNIGEEKTMQKMSKYFDALRSAVEPDEKYKKEAQKADDPVREHLETHKSFARHHVSTFLYGSYRRHTAEGNIKDVDIVVVTNFTTRDKPVAVLDNLKDSLAELYDEPDLADQCRSIRVDRPLPDVPDSELTLDVIPAIYQNKPGGPLWVPDRDKEIWVPSHPQGHIDRASELNARSHQERAFVRLAKMMKWWWKYQHGLKQAGEEAHKRKPKGFWIEVMTGQYTDLSKESYPELIVYLLGNAFNRFKSFRSDGRIPTLDDPGLSGQKIKTSITEDEFALFLDTVEESLGWAALALNASTEEKAAEYWQKLFGEKFPSAENLKKNESLLSSAAMPGGLSFPNKPVQPRKPGGFA